jgi:UDPglucose 6-dehydrogenase
MSLSIVGSGYVGTVTGVGFAALGNEVFFVDLDPDRVEALNRAASPISNRGESRG